MGYCFFALLLTAQVDLRLFGPERPETEADRQAFKVLQGIDLALADHRQEDVDAGLERLRQLGGHKVLSELLVSTDTNKKVMALLGFRLLPVKRAWPELRMMLLDRKPLVRQQAVLYANKEPAGLDADDLRGALQDRAPEVRIAAVGALIRVAKKPARAVALIRAQIEVEKNADVLRALKIGLTVLGAPTSPENP